MKTIEKVYIILSVLIFLIFLEASRGTSGSLAGAHGNSVYVVYAALLISLLLGPCGIFLAIRARKRKAAFWILIVATLMGSILFLYMVFGRYIFYISDGERKLQIFR